MIIRAKTATSLYTTAIDACLEKGEESQPRQIKQKELINLTLELLDPKSYIIEPYKGIERKPDYAYAKGFFDFVMSGATEMPESLIALNKHAAKFKNEDDRELIEDYLIAKDYQLPDSTSFYYGPRIAEQLDAVIENLKFDPDSRRSVITVLNGQVDNLMLDGMNNGLFPHLEYPCTIAVHFMIRNAKLVVIVTMRSQNLVSVLPYDMYNFANMGLIVADKLGVECDKIITNMHSAHIYSFDYDFAKRIAQFAL